MKGTVESSYITSASMLASRKSWALNNVLFCSIVLYSKVHKSVTASGGCTHVTMYTRHTSTQTYMIGHVNLSSILESLQLEVLVCKALTVFFADSYLKFIVIIMKCSQINILSTFIGRNKSK